MPTREIRTSRLAPCWRCGSRLHVVRRLNAEKEGRMVTVGCRTCHETRTFLDANAPYIWETRTA